jgi:hypothetical protein
MGVLDRGERGTRRNFGLSGRRYVSAARWLIKVRGAYVEKKGIISVQPYHKIEKFYEELSGIFN